MTLLALFRGCWLSHGELHWTHDVLTCDRCGTVIQVLPQPVVKGPAHDPEPVRGQPDLHAVPAKTAKPKKTPLRETAKVVGGRFQ